MLTNPEIASVHDSDRIVGLLHSKTKKSENRGERIKDYLVINRYSTQRANAGEMLRVNDIQELLSMDILGIIPESRSILTASNKGQPIILDAKSDAGKAYQLIVDRFLGTAQPYKAESKRSFWRTIFTRRTEGII